MSNFNLLREIYVESTIGYIRRLANLDLVNLFKAMICSSINLLIILIIVALFVGMSQGHVIPLDLYTRDVLTDPLNIILFHFLLLFLSLVMTLYPTYIYAVLFDQDDQYWSMEKWGIIYYYKDQQDKKGDYVASRNSMSLESKKRSSLRPYEAVIRKLTGVSLFLIWTYVLASLSGFHHYDTADKWLIWGVNIFATISVLGAFYFYQLKYNQIIKDPELVESIVGNSRRLFYLILFALLLLVLLNAYVRWNMAILIFQLVICYLFAIFIIIFRTFRSYYKSKWITNIVTYLHAHRIAGFISLALIILINVNVSVAQGMNVLNIFLLYLIAFYTALILPIKLYLYLSNSSNWDQKEKNKLRLGSWKLGIRTFNLMLFVILGYLVFINSRGNDLHQLKLVDQEVEEGMDISTFYSNTVKHLDGKIPVFYSAYGGGLKANYWNFLMLNALDSLGADEHIISMSGVSGGSMGIGLYSAAKYMKQVNPSFDMRQFEIDLRHANVLGIEMPWLMGQDLLRECLPSFLIWGYDRSHRSMKFYDHIMGGKGFADRAFNDVVRDFNNQMGYWPNMIFNSTATIDRYGVVSSVDGHNFFPAAFRLLNHDGNKSLTYLDAISTSNRFPVISPAAEVKSHGYFVDGGYFENSGMMSNISFRKALKAIEASSNNDSIFQEPSIFISVRNSPSNYLDYLAKRALGDSIYHHYDILKGTTEIGAMARSFFNLERMPSYLREMLTEYYQEDYEVIFLDLPYYIDPSDISKMLGGEVKQIEAIKDMVMKSNYKIDSLLRESPNYHLQSWGIVDPPTARILSTPAEEYMNLMTKHPFLTERLKQIQEALRISSKDR